MANTERQLVRLESARVVQHAQTDRKTGRRIFKEITQAAGEVVDMPVAEAQRHIDCGLAVTVDE